jgi:hypothetical protein
MLVVEPRVEIYWGPRIGGDPRTGGELRYKALRPYNSIV